MRHASATILQPANKNIHPKNIIFLDEQHIPDPVAQARTDTSTGVQQ